MQGTVAAAARRLHVSAQAISMQLQLLAERVGDPLFRKQGRRLQLTEAGKTVLRYTSGIFDLGTELEQAMRRGVLATQETLRVGICDIIPKTMAFRLLQPAREAGLAMRMLCREGRFEDLLAESGTHRLDPGPGRPCPAVRDSAARQVSPPGRQSCRRVGPPGPVPGVERRLSAEAAQCAILASGAGGGDPQPAGRLVRCARLRWARLRPSSNTSMRFLYNAVMTTRRCAGSSTAHLRCLLRKSERCIHEGMGVLSDRHLPN